MLRVSEPLSPKLLAGLLSDLHGDVTGLIKRNTHLSASDNEPERRTSRWAPLSRSRIATVKRSPSNPRVRGYSTNTGGTTSDEGSWDRVSQDRDDELSPVGSSPTGSPQMSSTMDSEEGESLNGEDDIEGRSSSLPRRRMSVLRKLKAPVNIARDSLDFASGPAATLLERLGRTYSRKPEEVKES
jgi:hypothetical protein